MEVDFKSLSKVSLFRSYCFLKSHTKYHHMSLLFSYSRDQKHVKNLALSIFQFQFFKAFKFLKIILTNLSFHLQNLDQNSQYYEWRKPYKLWNTLIQDTCKQETNNSLLVSSSKILTELTLINYFSFPKIDCW